MHALSMAFLCVAPNFKIIAADESSEWYFFCDNPTFRAIRSQQPRDVFLVNSDVEAT